MRDPNLSGNCGISIPFSDAVPLSCRSLVERKSLNYVQKIKISKNGMLATLKGRCHGVIKVLQSICLFTNYFLGKRKV